MNNDDGIEGAIDAKLKWRDAFLNKAGIYWRSCAVFVTRVEEHGLFYKVRVYDVLLIPYTFVYKFQLETYIGTLPKEGRLLGGRIRLHKVHYVPLQWLTHHCT